MGLETVHPEALERSNKKLTTEQFVAVAERLRAEAIDLRVFVLLQPPFVRADEALFWAEQSLDFAFECDATAVSLIPTRAGNGAVDTLAAMGEFDAPQLSLVEQAFGYGLGLGKGRVFVDLWDIERVPSGADCRSERIERLRRMNLVQRVLPAIACEICGASV